MDNSQRLITAERSIIKTYRPKIWRKFVNAVDEFDLVSEGDTIGVCISGGKDSFLMAKCFQELTRRSPKKFNLKFLVMDPGYEETNLGQIKHNAEILNIPIQIFESDIFKAIEYTTSPCYLCARMRRGYLYAAAKEAGCNKIALAHHFDDVIETILLSVIYGGEYKTMMPKLRSKNFAPMELIRPMYFIRERDVINWANYNGLEFLRCGCRVTQKAEGKFVMASKRREIKELISNLEKVYKNAPQNIYKSSCNVNIDAVIGYSEGGKKHIFLERFLRDFDSDSETDGSEYD